MNLKYKLPTSLYNIFISSIKYPVPPAINYYWNYGSLSLLASYAN